MKHVIIYIFHLQVFLNEFTCCLPHSLCLSNQIKIRKQEKGKGNMKIKVNSKLCLKF